jgi:hypothetical protein
MVLAAPGPLLTPPPSSQTLLPKPLPKVFLFPPNHLTVASASAPSKSTILRHYTEYFGESAPAFFIAVTQVLRAASPPKSQMWHPPIPFILCDHGFQLSFSPIMLPVHKQGLMLLTPGRPWRSRRCPSTAADFLESLERKAPPQRRSRALRATEAAVV